MPIDCIGDLALIDQAHNLFTYLAILEEKKSGDATDIEPGGSGTISVDIELSDFDATLILGSDCIDRWSQSAARTTPGSPEIDDHRFVRFEYL